MDTVQKLTLGILLAVVSTARADSFDIKVYSAPRLAGITIDGTLNEPSWEQAALAGGFTLYGKETPAEPQTFIRLGYDEAFLYVGVQCDEPRMDLFAPMSTARDTLTVFAGEAIEIFVDPEHSHSVYYQFGVNAAASVYDSRGEDSAWNANIRAATQTDSNGWSLECAIPWADLGTSPQAGQLLGFNVCRDRQIGGQQWTNWARTITGFHDPVRFAHLILAGNPQALAGHSAEFRKGDREGAVIIYTVDGFAESSYRAMATASLEALNLRLAAVEQKARNEGDAVRRGMKGLLATYREQIKPIADALASGESMDAKAWSQWDMRITRIVNGLEDALWTARLQALLSEL